MGLAAAFAKMQETLALVELDGPQPSFGLGAQAVMEADTVPRIVWVPAAGSIKRDAGQSGLLNPGPLWLRQLRVDAHIWAEDVGAVEELAGHMAAAMTDAGISYAMVDETWPREATTQEGVLGLFSFAVFLTMTREKLSEVLADTPVITGQIEEQVVS